MKTIYVNDVLKQITECERLVNLYNQLYETLSCPGFEQKDFTGRSRIIIDKKLEKGEFKSLQELGNYFDELADDEYQRANRLLKTDFKRAI